MSACVNSLKKLSDRRNPDKEVFLTFDVEEFLHQAPIVSLHRILKLLRKHGFRALFFLTGTMAEKISNFPEILELLKGHEIGYHSSTHSVKPRIFEYTDLECFADAVDVSLKMETSHVDPFTGKPKGPGGILFLREMFPNKSIISFRAPQLCWSPPHLEALRQLGFKFDFSTDISIIPVLHRGITFYPSPIRIDSISSKIGDVRSHAPYRFRVLISRILRQKCTVLAHHDNIYFRKWDEIFKDGVTNKMSPSRRYNPIRPELSFFMLDLLLKELGFLQRISVLRITPPLEEARVDLDVSSIDVMRVFYSSVNFSKELFGYEPRFLLSHFYHYFSRS